MTSCVGNSVLCHNTAVRRMYRFGNYLIMQCTNVFPSIGRVLTSLGTSLAYGHSNELHTIVIAETDINRCTKSSCHETAICINVALGKQCICPNGYVIEHDANNKVLCKKASDNTDLCSNYCLNGGVCRLTEKGTPKCR